MGRNLHIELGNICESIDLKCSTDESYCIWPGSWAGVPPGASHKAPWHNFQDLTGRHSHRNFMRYVMPHSNLIELLCA